MSRDKRFISPVFMCVMAVASLASLSVTGCAIRVPMSEAPAMKLTNSPATNEIAASDQQATTQ